MAVLHNKAGQHGKDEAQRKFNRWLGIGLLAALSIGFLGGAFLTRAMGFISFGVFMAALGAFWLVFKMLEPILDRFARERVKYLRGAQAEALVAWLLLSLDDEWHLFNQLQLREGSDLDHVLVGPGGVWCVSTKSHRGLIAAGPDGQLLYNNAPSDFANEALGLAMQFRDRLEALLGADVPYVNAVLAVPFAFTQVKNPVRHVWVLHQEEIVPTLRDAARRLSGKEVERLVRTLEMMAKSAKDVYRAPPVY